VQPVFFCEMLVVSVKFGRRHDTAGTEIKKKMKNFINVSIHPDFDFWNMTTCLWVSGSRTSNPIRPKSSETPATRNENLITQLNPLLLFNRLYFD
jgi:hypothetical protein